MNKKKFLGSWVIRRVLQVLLLYAGKYHRGLLNLVEPEPLAADIKVTERCDSRCVTCGVWKSEFKRNHVNNELTTQEWENVFYQFKEIGIKTVGFSGGEPLLRKDIGELVKKAKRIVGGKVYVVTNGSLLTKKAKLLLESGIDHVSVSIDGIGETNDKIRGVSGHYSRAVHGVQTLKELIKNGEVGICACGIGTTLVRSNLTEVPRLIELAQKLSVGWSFSLFDTELYYFKNVYGSLLLPDNEKIADQTIDYLLGIKEKRPDLFTLDPASLDFARNYLKGKRLYTHNCYLGYLRVYIDSQLNVYSGCWVLKPLGNLKEKKLKEIIKSDQYRKRVKEMFDLKCPGCTCGYFYNFMIGELPMTVKYFLGKIKNYRRYL